MSRKSKALKRRGQGHPALPKNLGFPQYLTNFRIGSIDPNNVRIAALRSQQDVRVMPWPMPKNPYDPDDQFYFPENLTGSHRSLAFYGSIDPVEGASPFWRELEKLEGRSHDRP